MYCRQQLRWTHKERKGKEEDPKGPNIICVLTKLMYIATKLHRPIIKKAILDYTKSY